MASCFLKALNDAENINHTLSVDGTRRWIYVFCNNFSQSNKQDKYQQHGKKEREREV